MGLLQDGLGNTGGLADPGEFLEENPPKSNILHKHFARVSPAPYLLYCLLPTSV